MKVLIVGSGGREHALAWKVMQSPKVQKIYLAPGNAGSAREPKCENIAFGAEDLDGLLRFAQTTKIDLTLVGPEAPLVAGIVDRFAAAGLRCFGPRQKAARLEGSKGFAKDFCQRHGIPTATYATFTDFASAAAYIQKQGAPIVVKADGLATGKGVIVAQTVEEAVHTAKAMLTENAFGAAGKTVVIEEFLAGEEASFIAMVDGRHATALATSQDHKRLHDGDQGPNTGGMGAYSPAPIITAKMHARIRREIIAPTVRGMREEECAYVGFLYAGLMITRDGAPKVLEFNCRFGDPEAQPIMMRLKSDLIELIEAALDGRLDQVAAQWDKRAALGVVMAAGGYPGSYPKGDVIEGLPVQEPPDCKVFHAGTSEKDGKIIASGGRVLCVTALGATVSAAQKRAYEIVEKIHWNNVHYRQDVGYRAIAREKPARAS